MQRAILGYGQFRLDGLVASVYMEIRLELDIPTVISMVQDVGMNLGYD